MTELVGLLPFVPSGKDFEKSRALFRELGFEEFWSADGYVGFRQGAAKFILQTLDDARFASNLMIKIEVPDLDVWWRDVAAKALDRRFPGFRIKPPTEFAWGREVQFIDLAGVSWRVGLP